MRTTLSFYLVCIILCACSSSKKPKYKDASFPVEERVEDLLSRMTLKEKVAQLRGFRVFDSMVYTPDGKFQPGKDSLKFKNGVGAFWSWDLWGSPQKRAHCINAMQKYLIEETRLGIPAFSFSEALHGFMYQGATSFPQAIALGSTWDTSLVEEIYTAVARETRVNGSCQVLSPVVDLARDPRWGRTEECYSEDPYLVSRIGLAAIFGLQGREEMIDDKHVAVTLKHFAGHGQPEGGRNIAPVNYSEREFRQTHLYPFEIAVKRGKAHSVMASYNEWDGVPNHVNKKLLVDILRKEWGFYGYVMSDGGGLDVIYRDHLAVADSAEAGAMALQAGVDFDLGSRGCFVNLDKQVKSGQIDEKVLDRAVRNVLRLKFMTGLFENPYVDLNYRDRVTNCRKHKELALKAARKALILLKNDRNTLPFDSTRIRTIAVIGPNAAEIHLGGYSYVPMKGISILDGVKSFAGKRMKVLYAEGCKITLNKECNWQVGEKPVMSNDAIDRPLISQAVNIARQSDAVILVLGENELINREAWSENHLGDRDNLELAGAQNALAQAVLETGKPVVIILLNGRPLAINYLKEKAPAIIEGWYLGQETGNAVADVVFGRVNPGGKLTITIPNSVGQLPCYYNRKPSRFRNYTLAENEPLYPFGFGLSYTTFNYSDLKLSANSIKTNGYAEVSVVVTNTGTRSGDEIVQLYIHDIISMPTRPVQELKDFCRITLEPGESRQLTFKLGVEKLQSLDLEMQPVVQPGDFAVMVGGSSVKYLSDTLHVVP